MGIPVERGAERILEHLGAGATGAWEARFLAENGAGRAVVEYWFFPAGPSQLRPGRRWVGKFYPDEGGRASYEAMKWLNGRLVPSSSGVESPGAVLAVPQPLFYDPRLRLLVQEVAPGEPFAALAFGPDSAERFRLAGRALARLHALPPEAGPVRSLRDHVADLIRPHPLALAEILPDCRPIIEGLLQKVFDLERPRRNEVRIAALHRDFHFGQMSCEAGRIWLFDWDRFARGDPALDVGNFVAYVETHPPCGSGAATEAFLEGYGAEGSPSVLERLPLYAALTYLRLASKRFRLKGDDWRERLERMLLRGEWWVARGSFHGAG